MSYLLNAGPAGLFAFALLFGLIYSKSAYQELKADRDEWRKAYEAERDGRLELQKSVDVVLEQGRTSLEQGKLIQELLVSSTRRKTT